MSRRAKSKLVVGIALVLITLVACGSDDTCTVGGRTYDNGASWTCDDGCNLCVCVDGRLSRTAEACSEKPGEAAGQLNCQANDGWHQHGDIWECGDDCRICGCDDGKVVTESKGCPSEGGSGNAPKGDAGQSGAAGA